MSSRKLEVNPPTVSNGVNANAPVSLVKYRVSRLGGDTTSSPLQEKTKYVCVFITS